MTSTSPNAPLLDGISQYEVDFVIPRIGKDLPLGIDPFLLYKSRDPDFQNLHSQLLDVFNLGIRAVREKDLGTAKKLFQFPEVSEIGLGYTRKGKRGAGLGEYLTELIIETLVDSPALLNRGVRHIEEMQLVSLGIGPDRISDIGANVIKQYLINYTQEQCNLWGLKMTNDVPINHIYDIESQSWHDGYFNLPVSSLDGFPILLVPRKIVRVLPWINYDDFFRMEFAAYLRAKRVKGRFKRVQARNLGPYKPDKEEVVQISRREVERIDRYVLAKEASAAKAQPSMNYLDIEGNCPETNSLKKKLHELPSGKEYAGEYQKLILEILNFLFVPELIDGELEVRTVDGSERRDIIFTNDSDESFWDYIRTEHSCLLIMFETKNTQEIETPHINQTATYLGDRIGRLGIIVSRNPINESLQKKIFSVYNDSNPRKIILTLSDKDVEKMLDMKCKGEDPMRYIQKQYRAFRTEVQ